MTEVELEEGGATLEEEGEDGTKADLETEEPPSCSETAGTRAKDHCDYLLDSIDAQLSQLQWQDSGAGIAGAITSGDTSLECSPNASWAAEMEGCCANQAGTSWGGASPARMEEYSWRLMHLLGSEQAPGNLEDQSDSNSICTEDFAARFREGMVDPLVISDGEGGMRAVAFPAGNSAEAGHATGIKEGPSNLLPLAEACEAAAEGFPRSTARRQEDILQQIKQEPEGDLYVALSISVEGPRSLSSMTRRESLESLGGRISRLSQSNTMDTPSSADTGKASSTGSRAPGPAPPEGLQLLEESIFWPLQHGGKCLEGSSRCGQDSQENFLSFNSPLLVEELGPSQPLRALGAGACGARAWDGESQPTETARSPSGRRQTEYEPAWSKSPPHSTPSLASQGEKSPWLIASSCPDQGLPLELEKLGEPGSAVQGFGATTQLLGSPESVAGGGRVVMQDAGRQLSSQARVGPGEPKREAPELVQQESVVPLGLAGRGVARIAESGGGEGTGRSCEPQPGPAERAACGLTRRPEAEAGISESREVQRGLDPHRDEGFLGPCKYKHVAGIPVTGFDNVSSDLELVRPATVQAHLCKAVGHRRATGRSPNWPRRPRRDSSGGLGSSNAATDEEEEEEVFLPSPGSIDWRSRSPARWSSVPSRAESSWEETRNEAGMEHQLPPGTARRRADPMAQDLAADRGILEESVARLQQDLGADVERLLQRQSWLRKADLSLSDVLGQKKGAAQDLEWLRGALERSQKEAEMLESHVKETRCKADEARADLLLLEYRRDSCLRELPALEKELSALRRQHSTTHSGQLGAFRAEVSSLAAEREELTAHVRHLEGSLSFLERRELERQLGCCKAELFSVQRAARARIEELQEKQTEALSGQIRDVQARETEQELRLSALEKLLSEKELELVRLREAVCALTAEKEVQERAMENLRDEHSWQLEKMQQEKELELARQREELQRQKQQALQEFAESLKQVEAGALQDQVASFQKEVENLTRVIKARDEEILRQREALQLQKESTRQLARELKLEAKETVQSALLQEQRKWEAEKRDALQMQRGTLEEQSQRAHAEAIEKERRTVSVLQNKTLELQKIIQELELHGRSLQWEKQEALEELRVLLQEEKTEAFRRLREELEQERARESDRLRARLQQLEEERSLLQTEQNEMSFREQEAQSHAEQAERCLAREIGLACQRFQDLLPGGLMAHGSPSPVSTSHALQLLHGVSEETQRYLRALQQEVEAQKRTVLRLQEEKEWELRQQREQLHMESKEALEALKEQLIQEHLQEIASLQRRQLKEARGGEQQRLRQQLREKDSELQAIQSSVAHWKSQTAGKLARQFEEELNAELEMRFSKDPPMGLRGCAERLDAEIGRLAMDGGEHPHLCPTSSPSRSATPTRGQHSCVSRKLLRQLEGRVRELRAENAIHRGGSLEDLTALRAEPGQTGRGKCHGATRRK